MRPTGGARATQPCRRDQLDRHDRHSDARALNQVAVGLGLSGTSYKVMKHAVRVVGCVREDSGAEYGKEQTYRSSENRIKYESIEV